MLLHMHRQWQTLLQERIMLELIIIYPDLTKLVLGPDLTTFLRKHDCRIMQ